MRNIQEGLLRGIKDIVRSIDTINEVSGKIKEYSNSIEKYIYSFYAYNDMREEVDKVVNIVNNALYNSIDKDSFDNKYYRELFYDTVHNELDNLKKAMKKDYKNMLILEDNTSRLIDELEKSELIDFFYELKTIQEEVETL